MDKRFRVIDSSNTLSSHDTEAQAQAAGIDVLEQRTDAKDGSDTEIALFDAEREKVRDLFSDVWE